jgi:hypothetical protein
MLKCGNMKFARKVCVNPQLLDGVKTAAKTLAFNFVGNAVKAATKKAKAFAFDKIAMAAAA